MPVTSPKFKSKKTKALIQQASKAPAFEAESTALLPLGAMLLAGSLSTATLAQTAPASADVAGTLGTVTVRDRDTMKQTRVSLADLGEYLWEHLQ